MPFVDQRWLGGMMTNFKTVKGSLKKLKDMQAQVEAGTEIRIKKEALMFERELAKLEKDIGGIQDMNALPDAMFVIDVGYHKIADRRSQEAGHPGHRHRRLEPLARSASTTSSRATTTRRRPSRCTRKAVADAVLEGKANATNEVVQAVAAEGDEFVEVSEGA